MYSRLEASQLRTSFWTVFGKYMAPVNGADGEVKMSWVNYKTGKKDIFFRMKTDDDFTMIAIELTHRDDEQRRCCLQQFLLLKNMLHQTVGEEWIWEPDVLQDGKRVARISKTLNHKNIYNKEDWPQIISFFKQRITALDLFWSQAKYSFELLD